MILNDLLQIKEKELAAQKKIVLRCCLAAGCISSNSKGVLEQLEKPCAKPACKTRWKSAAWVA